MIVCLVLEKEEPRLFFTVGFNLDFYCTSVDLFRFVELVELSDAAEIFCSQGTDVHQVNRLCAAELLSGFDIVVIRILQQLVLKGNAVNGCEECGMTAVVRPICINHADFGDGRVTLFADKVILTECDVVLVHSKTVILYKIGKFTLCQFAEAVECLNRVGNFVLCL